MPHKLASELRKLEYTALYVIGPAHEARPVRVGHATQLHVRFSELQALNWKQLKVHFLIWTPGRPIAARIEAEAHRILDQAKRRIHEKWFDVPADMAEQALLIAADNLKLKTFTHNEMVRRCAQMEHDRLDRLRLSGEVTEKRRPYFRTDKASSMGAYPDTVPEPRRRKKKKKNRRHARASRSQRTREKPNKDHPFR